MSLSTQPISEVFTWKESTPQVKIVIDQTQKLVGVLSEKWQKEIVIIDERIRKLLRLIQEEIKQRSEKLNYNYYSSKYPKRYNITGDQFERILNERILTWELLRHWQEMLSLGDPEIMKKKLLTSCWIEDFVYDSLEESDLWESIDQELPTMCEDELNDRLINNNWDDLHEVKSIWFFSIKLWKLWKEVLKTIFKNFTLVKWVWLSFTNLWDAWSDELEEIFKYFRWLTWIWLSGNDLWNLWRNELKVISRNLRGVKCAYLISNKLERLTTEELEVFFKNFKLVKYIDVSMNDFTDEQKQFIESLLPNTKIKF